MAWVARSAGSPLESGLAPYMVNTYSTYSNVFKTRLLIHVFTLNTCVFMCIQFEGPKSAEYTYSKA